MLVGFAKRIMKPVFRWICCDYESLTCLHPQIYNNYYADRQIDRLLYPLRMRADGRASPLRMHADNYGIISSKLAYYLTREAELLFQIDLMQRSHLITMEQHKPEEKCVVVVNPNTRVSEVQESDITSARKSSVTMTKDKFAKENHHEVNKLALGPTKVYIAFIVLTSLLLALFLAVIILIVAFAVEIPKLKSETDSADQQSIISTLANSAAEQQSSVTTLMNRLDSLNSSMDQLSQQLLQAIDSQIQEVASSLIQQVNSSLEALSQQLLQDISEIDNRTQQINSSLELFSRQLIQDISALNSRVEQVNSSQQTLSQQLFQDILAVDSRTQEINSSQQMLSQQLFQDILAVDSRTQEINSSQQMLSQQLLQDIKAVDSRTREINSSLSQRLLQDISEIDNRIEQVNSSQQMLSQELFQDVSEIIDNRIEQVNSSQQMLSQQLFQEVSEIIDNRIEQVNSSQKMLSQQLFQEVSEIIDNRIEQVNSSQQMLSQQLFQDVSEIDNRIGQVNSSQQMLSQQLFQEVSEIDNRIEQANSSQQMLSQQFIQDIAAVDSRTQEINSSLSRQLFQEVSDIANRIQKVNSSQQMVSQQLLQDISEIINNRIEQVNSSQRMLSQQLLQDITAVDSRTQEINSSLSQTQQDISILENNLEEVNASLLQQVNQVQTLAQETVDGLEALGEFPNFPSSSCAAILSSLPSGFYYVRNSTDGSAVSVYCDMTLSCGGVTGGWMRVVDVDFNDSSIACPSGFREDNDSDIRTCVKGDDDASGCTSIEYSASDVTYSSVCGKVIAYQVGTTEAFSRLIVISSLTVDSQYLDGISLTHGNPREHIWSFAMGVTESRTDRFGCPCNTGSTISVTNTFIGTNYFCDSAASGIASGMHYTNNPLFDGVGCDAMTNQCCSFNNPPRFYRQLPQSTADDLEIRACRDESGMTENSLIRSIQLYIR